MEAVKQCDGFWFDIVAFDRGTYVRNNEVNSEFYWNMGQRALLVNFSCLYRT